MVPLGFSVCIHLSWAGIVVLTDIAAMGGSYMFVRNAAANLREKEDSWNPTIGGFVAGAILGTRCMHLPAPRVLQDGLGTLIQSSSPHDAFSPRIRCRTGSNPRYLRLHGRFLSRGL